MTEAWPKVVIIILNWNGADLTIRCIETFCRIQYVNHQVIIVDNKSTDDSVNRMKQLYPNIPLIETQKNLGYAGGNNVGIKYALDHEAKYILIVNNDTELINPLLLQHMVEIMEDDPFIGIMGPKVFNPGNQVQDTILFTPTLQNCIAKSLRLRFGSKKSRNYDIPQDVEAVSGVCWLIRKEVIEAIQLLDEDYFMYAEDQDYCYRAQKAGWKILYYPIESIVHCKESAVNNRERNYWQYVYARRNLVLFLYKHFSLWNVFLLATFFLFSNILKAILSYFKEKENDFYNIVLLKELVRQFKEVLTGKKQYANTQ